MFYKLVDENNIVTRIDESDFNVSGGTEITEEEYLSILEEIKTKNPTNVGTVDCMEIEM